MRTLVYKRTHNGDPDALGQFGIRDCMGSVRARDYDAVIGVGGTGDEPRSFGLAEKVNWIGIGPHKSPDSSRGPLVTFDHFLLFGNKGPALVELAPSLAAHIYGKNVRSLMTFTEQEQREVGSILELAKNAPPSEALDSSASSPEGRCQPGSAKVINPEGSKCR
jgi:hypothetical protein